MWRQIQRQPIRERVTIKSISNAADVERGGSWRELGMAEGRGSLSGVHHLPDEDWEKVTHDESEG